jgi:hypothetical protein
MIDATPRLGSLLLIGERRPSGRSRSTGISAPRQSRSSARRWLEWREVRPFDASTRIQISVTARRSPPAVSHVVGPVCRKLQQHLRRLRMRAATESDVLFRRTPACRRRRRAATKFRFERSATQSTTSITTAVIDQKAIVTSSGTSVTSVRSGSPPPASGACTSCR